MDNSCWHIFPDPQSVAETACQHILQAAEQAIQQRDAFHLVLAGGSTPEQTYHLLAKAQADWSKWHIYYGDERCLPVEHPERNSQMAQQAWLAQSTIPSHQQHAIPAELGAETAAQQYAQTIETVLPFDVVLLGMGEDGHTASLFPGYCLETQQLTQAVFDAPKPPPERVSLTVSALQNTQKILFLVTGANKREALQAWQAGKALPAREVAIGANAHVFVDQVASI